jgi:DNA-binding cell septation regulator SpoVG
MNTMTATALAVRIDAIKAYSKNTLVGFCDFTLPDVGLSIKGATIHEKEGSRWVSMPARSYSDSEGTHWAPIVEFASREAKYRINDAVLAAYDLHAVGGAK